MKNNDIEKEQIEKESGYLPWCSPLRLCDLSESCQEETNGREAAFHDFMPYGNDQLPATSAIEIAFEGRARFGQRAQRSFTKTWIVERPRHP